MHSHHKDEQLWDTDFVYMDIYVALRDFESLSLPFSVKATSICNTGALLLQKLTLAFQFKSLFISA